MNTCYEWTRRGRKAYTRNTTQAPRHHASNTTQAASVLGVSWAPSLLRASCCRTHAGFRVLGLGLGCLLPRHKPLQADTQLAAQAPSLPHKHPACRGVAWVVFQAPRHAQQDTCQRGCSAASNPGGRCSSGAYMPTPVVPMYIHVYTHAYVCVCVCARVRVYIYIFASLQQRTKESCAHDPGDTQTQERTPNTLQQRTHSKENTLQQRTHSTEKAAWVAWVAWVDRNEIKLFLQKILTETRPFA